MTETFYAAIFGYDEVSYLYTIEHKHSCSYKLHWEPFVFVVNMKTQLFFFFTN